MARDYTLSATVPPPEVPVIGPDGTLTEEWRLFLEALSTALFGPTGGEDVTQPISGGVVLGVNTSGDYVATLSNGAGVTVTGGKGEGSTAIISIGQDVSPTSSPSFSALTVGGVNILIAVNGKVDRVSLSDATTDHPTHTDFAGVKADLDALGSKLNEVLTALR